MRILIVSNPATVLPVRPIIIDGLMADNDGDDAVCEFHHRLG